MTTAELILYWEEFLKEGSERGWSGDDYDEYQFAQWLIKRSEYERSEHEQR